MHSSEKWNSDYARYVEAAAQAHLRHMLRFAGSGWLTSRETRMRLNEFEAEECVQDAFVRLLSAIRKRNPRVMELILDHPPDSSAVRAQLIVMLKQSAIDRFRKVRRIVNQTDLDESRRSEDQESQCRGSAFEVVVDSAAFDLHASGPNVEDDFAKRNLLDIYSGAVASGILNQQYQKAFRLMIEGLKDDNLNDYEIARRLGISKDAFQKMRHKIIKKLQKYCQLDVGA